MALWNIRKKTEDLPIDMGFINKYKHFLMMHVVIFIWGFTGVLGKLLQEVPSHSIVFYRMLIGFLSVGVFLAATKRGFKLSKKKVLQTMGVGIIIAAHWVTFFQAIHYSNVSFALIFFATTALFTSFIEPLLMKKPFDSSELFMGIIVVGGIFVIGYDSFQLSQNELNPNQDYTLAMICATCSAFLAALFSVLNANLVQKNDAVKITFYELLSGFIGIAIVYSLVGGFSNGELNLEWIELVYLLILGVVCTAFAFFMGIYLMRFITPFTMNLSVNMEPIYAMILALIIFTESEKMSWMFYVGAVIILGAVFMNAIVKAKRKKRLLAD